MNKENAFLLFIASAREDAEQAARITADLAAQGFSFWTEQDGSLPAPSNEDDALQKAIRASSALLLVLSSSARSTRSLKAAWRIAQMYRRPVYLVCLHAETGMEALPLDWEGTSRIDACGDQYPYALQTLVKELRSLQTSCSAHPETAPPLTASTPHPRNPYKGLRAFQRKDAGDFFGREQWIDTLAQALQEVLQAAPSSPPAPRFFAVIGPPGSGKSSVIRAGLLPQLEQGRLPRSDEWISLKPMTPGQHPLDALAFVLSEHFPERSLTSLREELEDIRGFHRLATLLRERKETERLESSAGLRPFSSASLPHQDTKVLLFLDQFEELFTRTLTEEERQHFLDLLITAMTEPQGPVIVLLALRADFYDRPLRSLALGPMMEAHHQALLPMTLQELQAVIEKPASLPDVQLRFEDNLVGDLLFDVQGAEGALPLLQFTLMQLVERRNGVWLTHQAYEEIGGVKGALATQAESTYLSLPSAEHQRWARVLFLRLIDPWTVDQPARCGRLPLSDLLLTDPRETTALEMTWRTFTEKHILATSTIMGIPTLEVSHERLLGTWGRLKTWLEEARDDPSVPKTLGKDATLWRQQGKPAERLYTGEQLAEAQRWRTPALPSRDEDAFLQASAQHQQRVRHRTMRRAVIASMVVLGLTGGAFSLSRLLPPRAAASVPTRPSVQVLPYTYTGHSDPVISVVWSPDGTRIASGSDDQTVQVWEAGNGKRLQTYSGQMGIIENVAWSPDGTHIASACTRAALVWEVKSGKRLQTYLGHRGTVNSVAWSPDGTRIASAGFRTVQVWEVKSGKRLQTYLGHRGFVVYSVAWSPDGTRIASGSFDKTVQVWAADVH